MTEERLSKAAERAVRLLVANPGMTAREFGLLMWPDSPHHERWQGSVEQGMAKGRVMWLRAGSYLHHLSLREGLVERLSNSPSAAARWKASDLGREILKDLEGGGLRKADGTEEEGARGE